MKQALIASVMLVTAGVASVASQGSNEGPVYLTATVERGKVKTTISATGRVEAVIAVDVSSQLSGQVDEVFVDFNDNVAKDQPLARLDQQGFQARVREAEADLAIADSNVQAQRVAVERAATFFQSVKAEAEVYSAKTGKSEADYKNAKRELERKETLRNKGHLSESDVDSARAEYEAALASLQAARAEQVVHGHKIAIAETEVRQAEAQERSALADIPKQKAILSRAKVELERSIIRSPIAGIVIRREAKPGQTVATSLEAPTLFRIAQDLHEMEVHARIDEADIGRVRVGQKATFRVDAFSGQQFTGQITQIRKAPDVVKNVVTYKVIITTRNNKLLLLPGMTALIEIVVRTTDEVLVLPNAALRLHLSESEFGSKSVALTGSPDEPQGTEADIWVLGENGEPKPVRVRLGLSNATVTEVTADRLREGEEIVVGTVPGDDERRLFGIRLGF